MALDILIKNATIIDGTGKPSYPGNLGILGKRIVAMGNIQVEAATVIDAGGLVACPGFIDPHTHVDASLHEYPLAENMIMQGVTTCIAGNCGNSLAPWADPEYFRRAVGDLKDYHLVMDWRTFGEWLERVETRGSAINFGALVGHGTLRGAVMGSEYMRRSTPGEIEKIKALLEESLAQGALGLSVGIDMPWPGYYAAFDEFVAIARVAQRYGVVFSPHTRHLRNLWPSDNPADLLYSVYDGPKAELFSGRYHGLIEAIEICVQAGQCRLHIAHLPLAYLVPQPHPEFLDEAIARATLSEVVDRGRAAGLDLTFNVIASPFADSGATRLIDLFMNPVPPPPPWLAPLREMGVAGFIEQLKQPQFRARLRKIILSGQFKFGVVHPATDAYWADRHTILRCKEKSFEGRTVGEIARRRSDNTLQMLYETCFDVLFDILNADPDAVWILSSDNRGTSLTQGIFLQHSAGMPCTDQVALPAATPDLSKDLGAGFGISPAAYGYYASYIETFVRRRCDLTLEQAIHKATLAPAEIFGLSGRGLLQEGAYADLVLFDPQRISAPNDLSNPARHPEGIARVLVNGVVVFENGRHTGKLPGMVLRRTSCI